MSMMYRQWRKANLTKYMKLFGGQATARLLAGRGNVYASEREGGGWLIYPTVVDEDLLPEDKRKKYFKYGGWLEELNAILNTPTYKAAGPTYLFKPDGSIDGATMGTITYQDGKVIIDRERIGLKGSPWRNPFAKPYSFPVNVREVTERLFSEPQRFLLPGVVELPATPQEGKLMKLLKAGKTAAIYIVHTDRKCYDNIRGEFYDRMGCVVSDSRAKLLEYFTAHPDIRNDVVALFAAPIPQLGEQNKPGRLWHFFRKHIDWTVEEENCCISYQGIREKTEGYALTYQMLWREGRADNILNLDEEDEKEKKEG